MRFDPRSKNVRIRVYQRNSSARRNPAGLGVVEIEALSASPGRLDVEPMQDDTEQQKHLLRAQKIAREYLDSPKALIGASNTPYVRAGHVGLFPYQEVGVSFFIERAALAARDKKFGDRTSKRNLVEKDFEPKVNVNNPVRVGIFDPMGLGKTNQGLGCFIAALELSARFPKIFPRPLPALILCPLNLVASWKREFLAFTNLTEREIRVPDDTLTPKTYMKMLTEGAQVIISNPDKFEEIDMNELPEDMRPLFFLVDEADWVRNPESERSLILAKIMANAVYTVLMTGTPAVLSSFDILPMLDFLNGHNSPVIKKLKDPITGKVIELNPIDVWLEKHDVPDDRVFKAGGIRDLTFESDANKFEPSIRRVAVRRSRAAVRASKTVPDKFLQQNKVRSLWSINKDLGATIANDELRADAEEAWRDYTHIVEDVFLTKSARSVGALDLDSVLAQHVWGPYRNEVEASKAVLEHNAKNCGAVAYRQALSKARSAYVTLTESVRRAGIQYSNDFDAAMERVAITHASLHQNQLGHERLNLVYYMPRISQTVMLRDDRGDPIGETKVINLVSLAVKHLSKSAPHRLVYVLTGETKDNKVYKNGNVIGSITAADIEREFGLDAKSHEPKTLIVSAAGRVGLNVLTGDVVAMMGRDSSPVMEDQVEDRINRTGRRRRMPEPPGPRADYIIPFDVFGFALSHRLENRRRNIAAMMGETVGDKNTIGSDLSQPVDVKPALKKFFNEAFEEKRRAKASGVTAAINKAQFKLEVAQNFYFMIDPEGYVKLTIKKLMSSKPAEVPGTYLSIVPDPKQPRVHHKAYTKTRLISRLEMDAYLNRNKLRPIRATRKICSLMSCAIAKNSTAIATDKGWILEDGTWLNSVANEPTDFDFYLRELAEWKIGVPVTEQELASLSLEAYRVLTVVFCLIPKTSDRVMAGQALYCPDYYRVPGTDCPLMSV